MVAEEGKGDGHIGAAELMTPGLPLEVAERTLDVSALLATSDGGRGITSLSANTSGTPFFSPSCFRTPARSLPTAGGATAYKTARSHLDTADSVSVEVRSGMLAGFRAPCFNVTGESPTCPLTSPNVAAVSPIPVHASGEIPTEEDVDSPVKQIYVEPSALEGGSPCQPDDSREAAMYTLPTGQAREDEFHETSCMNRDAVRARKNKRKMRYSQDDCLNASRGIVLVDAPVQEEEYYHGRSCGGTLFHSSPECEDHDQYGSSLVVPSTLYDDAVMSDPWCSRSQGGVPTVDTYLDVMTPASLTTPGELTALDKLNRLLMAFNERGTRRAWIMGRSSDMRLLK